MSNPIHICGGNGVYVPETDCTDCDRALYLIGKLTERLNNMSIMAYRGSYAGTGASVTTATVTLENYEYSSEDVFLVFVNGLNLLGDEFSVSGSGSTVTVTLQNPVNMSAIDVLEVVALKYDKGLSESDE